MCKGCHSTIYQQYSRTDMAHSTSLPENILDKGWLTQPVDIFNPKLDRHYQVFAREGKVYQSEYGLDQLDGVLAVRKSGRKHRNPEKGDEYRAL